MDRRRVCCCAGLIEKREEERSLLADSSMPSGDAFWANKLRSADWIVRSTGRTSAMIAKRWMAANGASPSRSPLSGTMTSAAASAMSTASTSTMYPYPRDASPSSRGDTTVAGRQPSLRRGPPGRQTGHWISSRRDTPAGGQHASPYVRHSSGTRQEGHEPRSRYQRRCVTTGAAVAL